MLVIICSRRFFFFFCSNFNILRISSACVWSWLRSVNRSAIRCSTGSICKKAFHNEPLNCHSVCEHTNSSNQTTSQSNHLWGHILASKRGRIFETPSWSKEFEFCHCADALFWKRFREAARLQFTKHAVNTVRNISTRRFSSLLCYVLQIRNRTQGPKNGATKRTQKWSQKVDPKMGPPLMNLLIATPFLCPRFHPTFCCDPTFEHNFEATEASQHKQNLYGWIRLKAKQIVRKHVCPWKQFRQAHVI